LFGPLTAISAGHWWQAGHDDDKVGRYLLKSDRLPILTGCCRLIGLEDGHPLMRLLSLILSLLTALLLLGLGGIALGYRHFSQGLPEYEQLKMYQPSVTTRIHAGDGVLVAEFATERRVFVPVPAMPKRVLDAFIAAEDQNFYQHRGVDWVAVMRAGVNYLASKAEGRRPGGASTITQQVARYFLLSNELSFARKFREWILAYRLEEALSKDRILELYLNEIYLGNRAYGVAAASMNYFDKALDELTIAEAAFLASMPKAPDRYFRERFRDAAMARRNYVIGRMLEDGFITDADAATAVVEPMQFRDVNDRRGVEAGYFVEEVRREISALYGEKSLYGGGLSVRSSLDTRLQDIATRSLRAGLMAYDHRDGWRGPLSRIETLTDWQASLEKLTPPPGGEGWQQAVVLETTPTIAKIGFSDGSLGEIPVAELKWARRAEKGQFVGKPVKVPADALDVGDVIFVEALGTHFALRQLPEIQGALVAMDPHTGRVLAMTGGFSPRISVFNRATQASRQPGSAFKPFVYLAALEKGLTPSSLILDAPFALDQGAGLGKWRPANYSEKFYGPTPLRVGVERSRNVMTVRLAQYIGMEPVVDVASRFGITPNLQPVLSMALGAGETTVLKLTAAYGMLVNGGRRIEPTIIDRVQDSSGKTIYRHDSRACTGCQPAAWDSGSASVPALPDTRAAVADPRNAYQIVSMLEGVVQRGTGVRIREVGKPLAGKTGTTNDALDVWFVGFSPDLVVGVFVGFDQPRSLGDNESGASVSVPIFRDFMAEALKDAPATPFRVPPGVRLVKVEPDTGRLAASGDRRAIWEAFIPGTEPTGREAVLDGGQDGAFLPSADGTGVPSAQPVPPQGVGTGTGGVY
jgi:penicillin-binding protein 1A